MSRRRGVLRIFMAPKVLKKPAASQKVAAAAAAALAAERQRWAAAEVAKEAAKFKAYLNEQKAATYNQKAAAYNQKAANLNEPAKLKAVWGSAAGYKELEQRWEGLPPVVQTTYGGFDKYLNERCVSLEKKLHERWS